MSRFLWSKGDDTRSDADNGGTVFFRFLAPPQGFPRRAPHPGPSFQDVFWRHYATIQVLLNTHAEPGLGLLVAGPEGLEASAWFEAKDREVNPLIIGRHSAADVFLPSDPGLSLRHLAVMLYRRQARRAVRFRVLDLRTPAAFSDEGDTPLEAVEAEGPLMIRCASFSLLFFPTGGPSDPWPADPAQGWTRIPGRHYLASESADPDRWLRPGASEGGLRPAPLRGVRGEDTLVNTFPGPIFATRTVGASDYPRGEVLVSSPSGRVSLRLGGSAARQGLLLGRYERCDTAGLPVLSSPALSRVHLLLIELEGTLYAVDTASTNGLWLGTSCIRSTRVEPGLPLSLAYQAAVEWRPIH